MFYHVYVMSTENQNCRFITYDYFKNNMFYSRSQMPFFLLGIFNQIQPLNY